MIAPLACWRAIALTGSRARNETGPLFVVSAVTCTFGRSWMLAIVIVASLVVAACARSEPGPDPLGPVQAPGYLSPAVLAKAADFRGTCSWGRAPGNPALYRVRLRARAAASGTILVRSTAFFDPADTSNILGELPSDSVAFGDGPVHDGRSDRRGWAILVRGNAGRVCRGYVSDSSVRIEPGR